MGRKEVLSGYKLSSAQSLAANFTSNAITVYNLDNVGFNISTSSVTDNTGTFGVQHRIIKNTQDPGQFSDWADLTLSPTAILANADATLLINLNQLPPGQVRVKFTAAGGTPNGTCNIWVSGCSVGA